MHKLRNYYTIVLLVLEQLIILRNTPAQRLARNAEITKTCTFHYPIENSRPQNYAVICLSRYKPHMLSEPNDNATNFLSPQRA